MTDRLLNLAEVAKRLSVSRSTAWRLLDAGEIPVIRLSEKIVRVDSSDLESFIESRRRQRPVAEAIRLPEREAT